MTDPITIDNISAFFELSQYEYRVFDMSRTVQLMPNETFKSIETQQAVYPTPFQQQAWLGIIFWHPETTDQPAIWFLKFPIDEMGFLKLEARDQFIQEMLEQVGEKIKSDAASVKSEDSDNEGSDKAPQQHENEFAFKPSQDKMAIFNALATRALGSTPSKYYQHAKDYLSGKLGYDQWSFLGFQGLADVVANLDKDDNEKNSANAIVHMPEQPLMLFSQLLEHAQPGAQLSEALLNRLTQELDETAPTVPLVTALARGLSQSGQRDACMHLLLESSLGTDIEILALIASRAWQSLQDPSLLMPYLEALAQQEQQSFDVILMELLPIPDMRDTILSGLRNPQRSAALAKRIGGFMQRFQGSGDSSREK